MSNFHQTADCETFKASSAKHASPFRALVSLVSGAVKAHGDRVAKRRRIRADRQVLMSKPDHMLKDIGIRRSEIDYVLNNGREIDKARTVWRLPG